MLTCAKASQGARARSRRDYKGYDADSMRSLIREHGAIPNIPNRANRTKNRWKKAI
jgi:transposase